MRALLLTILLLTACGDSDESPKDGDAQEHASEPKKPDPVTVVAVESVARGDVSKTLITSAVVDSEGMSDVVPQTSGIVVSVHKDEGDEVRKGTLLAVLENFSLDAGNERSIQELARVQKEVRELQLLFDRGAISQKELEEANFRLQTAQSSAREAEGRAGFTRLTAPFAGVVAARDVRRGALAATGQRAFQIVDLDTLRVVASLPERDLSAIKVDQRAKLVSAYDTDIWAWGVVQRIAPIVDANSGTFRVTVALNDNPNNLRPGQFVSVELVVDEHVDTLVVPKEAVVWEDGRPVAYRMIPKPPDEPSGDEDADDEASEDEDAGPGWFASLFASDEEEESEEEALEEEQIDPYVAERVSLELGLVDSDLAEILGGLEFGDQVVTVGQSNLRDGAPVRTPEMQREAARIDEVNKNAKDEKDEGAAG